MNRLYQCIELYSGFNAIVSGNEMRSHPSRIKEVLEKNGYSKNAIGEILDWYAPSKKEKQKTFVSQ